MKDVIGKLAKDGGILGQIDYSRDFITIMESGYGVSGYDSFGIGFRAAESLDSSFIHVVQPLKSFNSNGKNGLTKVLSDLLVKNNYRYLESFVSQIRVLSLHRLIKSVSQDGLGLKFRKIHIVTVTDDADVNDQWRMDYYTIKRDPKKMKQLNELHSKYIYNSFTQTGGGYLDERESFTDTRSKNHIYMYDYVTRQQKTNDIYCNDDSIIKIAPLDGRTLDFQLNQKQIDSDSVCFAYIDTVTINSTSYPIGLYLSDRQSLELTYDMGHIRNDIVIRGKVQVLYTDSIYGGLHYKTYGFVQNNEDYTSPVHAAADTTAGILIVAFLLLAVFLLWILPYGTLFTVYSSNGWRLRVRRGYRWQWDKLTPLAYHDSDEVVFAKHACFKKKELNAGGIDSGSSPIIIDSPLPLTFAGNVLSDSTRNNILKNARNTYGKYPKAVLQMYEKTLAGRIAGLQNSRTRFIRLKLYPLLNKLIFRISPHYYYWGREMEGLVSTPALRDHHFLLECNHKGKHERPTSDDNWLYTYYRGDYPVADILVCLDRYASVGIVWDVYQLCSRKLSGCGISSAKHLMHYRQRNADDKEIPAILKCLKNAIRKETKLDRIVVLDNHCKRKRGGIKFRVTRASCMAYVCLVETTEEEKCQMIYSPFTDSDSTEKNIVIDSSKVSRHVWTSLVPFASKKKRPHGDVADCESLDIIREGVSCQKTLLLKPGTIELGNIKVTPERTK